MDEGDLGRFVFVCVFVYLYVFLCGYCVNNNNNNKSIYIPPDQSRLLSGALHMQKYFTGHSIAKIILILRIVYTNA